MILGEQMGRPLPGGLGISPFPAPPLSLVAPRLAGRLPGLVQAEQPLTKCSGRLGIHCFGGTLDQAQEVIALGHLVSFTGIVTFKNARQVQATAQDIEADRFMVETDCPYLAPVPMRGRRNEPAFLPYVLAKLAEIRGWSLEEAEARAEDAFYALFDRAERP